MVFREEYWSRISGEAPLSCFPRFSNMLCIFFLAVSKVEFMHGTLSGQEGVNAGLFMDNENQRDCIVVCEVEKMSYMGSTAGQSDGQRVFIALKNKKTNKVSIVFLFLDCNLIAIVFI